ncbi:MAG TPA: hypothetical protein GXZ82_07615 [Firmicutes bacterium]|jgi:hypothetical protein|nr:hypothetical protein [Bacillota bacterium]
MPRLPYKVIYNQDWTGLFIWTKDELIKPSDVDAMVDEIADSSVDLLLINPNAQKVNYPSTVWETEWENFAFTDPDRFTPAKSYQEALRQRHWVGQMRHLALHGCDYLARALARCRQRGISPGVSVRMGDVHGYRGMPHADSPRFSRFFKEHPEYHLPGNERNGWSGLDFKHQAVRDHYLALINELVRCYDIDVLELDFMRHPPFLDRADLVANARIITDFVTEVRRLMDAADKPIALTARVAATPAQSYELGLDVRTWAQKGLIAGITAAQWIVTGWEIRADEYRRLVGEDVSVYVGADHYADRRRWLPERRFSTRPEYIRGFAAAQLANGADGCYLFNFFVARHSMSSSESVGSEEPCFFTLREIHTLADLRGKAKTYLLTGLTTSCESDLPCQIPREVPPNNAVSFELLLAAETGDVIAELHVLVAGDYTPETIRAQLNEYPLGGPVRDLPEQLDQTQSLPAAGAPFWGQIRRLIYALPLAALRDGVNTVVVKYNRPLQHSWIIRRWSDLNDLPAVMVLGVECQVIPQG